MKTRVNQQQKMSKSGKGKKVTVILIVLLVLACAFGGGMFYCMKKGITLSQLKVKIEQSKATSKKETKTIASKNTKKEVQIKNVDYVAYNWISVNLRATPGGKKIYGINKNSILNVKEELDSGWLKVKVADKEGYISAKYTKDRNGYYRDSYKTRNLTKRCNLLINKCFTSEEKKILKQYEFRYMPDYVADNGGGAGKAVISLSTTEPNVMYFRDSSFKTASSHDEVILHELCHAITPEVYGYNSPFANRLKVAGYDAGIKKVKIHLSKNEESTVSTGR